MSQFFIIFSFLSLTASAQIKPQMQSFYFLTEKIQPYIYNKTDFFNEENQKIISQTLKEFNEQILILKKNKLTQSDDMKFRFQQLATGLTEAEQSFNTGFKDYSYWILKSSFNNCFTCHTQKGLPETHYTLSSLKKGSLYSQADFLFMVRNYSEATKLFEDIIISYPNNNIQIDELEDSLKKLLFYSMRVLKNDAASTELFDKLLQNLKLPTSMRTDILAWKKYLNIKKYGLVDFKVLKTGTQIEEFVLLRNHLAGSYKLSNQRYIIDLETSQHLFELLEKSKNKDLRPWILYWLAYQEKDYRASMFDISSENYLKECIEKFSHHKAAKKCFSLYKEIITDSFTGSRGVSLPGDIKNLLNKYEKLIN